MSFKVLGYAKNKLSEMTLRWRNAYIRKDERRKALSNFDSLLKRMQERKK
ncbi:hypothetical protein [Candidatus Borreliella tachyglossi]|nr:hypothetical protein [Candidatus Borreliella tachyglossi]